MPKKHKHTSVRTIDFCTCGAISTDRGAWIEGKDPAAVALSAKAIATSTPEERREKALVAGETRWAGKTPAEKSEYMRWMASHPRPSRRSADRCPCGIMTRERAELRNHQCTAPVRETAL